MNVQVDATVECDMIGMFTDGEPTPPERATASKSEIVQTTILGEFTEYAQRAVTVHGFLIQLKSLVAPITVRGHALRYLTNGQASTATYAVVRFENGEETIVALFPASEVVGIFEGDAGALPARVSA